jgi:hypothetical protein
VVPASLTAIGYNDGCILAVRRQNTRDPHCADEWYAVDIAANEVLGPFESDSGLAVHLKGRGLIEPTVMQLPEDLRR